MSQPLVSRYTTDDKMHWVGYTLWLQVQVAICASIYVCFGRLDEPGDDISHVD
jgi:hypothetical protein